MRRSSGNIFTRVFGAAFLALVLAGATACSTTETLNPVTQVAPVPEKFSAIIIDAGTGTALYTAQADQTRYPASLTKMMTLYLLFQALESGRITRDTPIPVSANAASKPASKLYLKAGSTIPVDTAIRALVVKSANDVATAVAEFLAGGSEERFAEIMTRQARALGMSKTRFTNASGLPDPNQVTCATDMARLAVALKSRFPQYYAYFSLRSFEYNGKTIRGHNKALDMIPGADGLKTGYTRASGFNLATSTRRNGRYLVGVVMGEDLAKVRDQRMADLMQYYALRQ
ncbi:MAG: penicillin-binding protein [Rhizobiales bacterium]|nr:penicillin-binding protein [Hyphomicrobiales bacterium]